MKRRTTLYLEEELVKTAKEVGLNLSKTCEMALEEAKTAPRITFGGPAGTRIKFYSKRIC